MQIKSITRTYSRSLNFKKPDGSEIWIRHEASVEASLDEQDAQDLTGCYGDLTAIVMGEVGRTIKEEKAKIMGVGEPFPGKAPSVSTMPKL